MKLARNLISKDICQQKEQNKMFSSTRANNVYHRKFACVHWALQRHRQASQYTK